jgi:hypothetical protein
MPRIAVKKAVEAYLGDAVNRNTAVATLDKLETIFKKQFLPWTEAQGFEYIGEIELDALAEHGDRFAAVPTTGVDRSFRLCLRTPRTSCRITATR